MAPVAVNLYSRYMADKFDERQMIAVNTTGLSFFGRPEHGSKTVYSPDAMAIEIDIIRGNRKLGAMITRGHDSRDITGKTGTTQNFTNVQRLYPLGEEKSPITASQLVNRLAGEGPYERRSKIDRLRELALNEHLEHIRRFVRTFEYLSWQSLLTGKMPSLIGTTNTDLIYDFQRTAALITTPAVLTPATPYWDSTGSNPITNLETMFKRILVYGKVKPNVVFMADDVMPVFLANANVKDAANKDYYQLVQVAANNPVPSNLPPIFVGGAICRGLVTTPNGYQFWLFSYVSVYEDSAGVVQDYMPGGTVFMGYYGARCDRYFGPSNVLPPSASQMAWYQEMFGFNMAVPPMPTVANGDAVISAAMFYNDAYEHENQVINIRHETPPIFATNHTDAFATLTEVLTPES